ncbi:hypothetical protein NAPIS_ORF00113 [Vairimorpha apis BRL 01]|uniref:Uncharacterized protein n=1 Tax=Vairimorpha apis BRL 01 TaxID=1037528 RepID=T0L480_9MICR|nr:hypothetical protein NAPIS_ORF00113 [Vairimorpha apis BRL 01]
MSLIQILEKLIQTLKKDLNLPDNVDSISDYEYLLQDWDKYKEFEHDYLTDKGKEEFLELSKNLVELDIPNLMLENKKLHKAVKTIGKKYSRHL